MERRGRAVSADISKSNIDPTTSCSEILIWLLYSPQYNKIDDNLFRIPYNVIYTNTIPHDGT
jgi:hypothetical protein